jgi:hypothetical protein
MIRKQVFVFKIIFSYFRLNKIKVNITTTKLELAKLLLHTTDEGIINHIKAVFSTQSQNRREELPEEIKLSVERGLIQSGKGQAISHDQVMKRYKK